MTHRDRLWRGFGVGLVLVASVARLADGDGTHTLLALAAFVLMLAGLVLIVQGKRVPAAFRVERGRHRLLVHAIRARRRTRSGDPDA